MSRALVRSALVAAALLLGGCCEQGQRQYVIDAPDPDLLALLQACIDASPCTGVRCTTPACVTACNRVAELSGDTRAATSIVECSVRPYVDGGITADASISTEGVEVWVSISYDTCK